jgi:hypothetical protein
MGDFNRGTATSSGFPAVREDFSNVIYEADPADHPILTLARSSAGGASAASSVHKYQERPFRRLRTTLNGSITSGQVNGITFTDATFRAGDRVRIDQEVILLGSTSDNLSFDGCTRSLGTGAAASHADGAISNGIGKAHVQGSSSTGSGDLIIEPDVVTTWTKIYKRKVSVAESAEMEIQWGKPISQAQWEIMEKGEDIKTEQERDCFWGVGQARVGQTTPGAFDGFYERIVGGGNNTDLGGSAYLDMQKVRTAMAAIRDYGHAKSSSLLSLACSVNQKLSFDGLGDGKIIHQTPAEDAVAQLLGTDVRYLYILNRKILLIDLEWLDDEAYLLDFSKIKLLPYRNEKGNREMFYKPFSGNAADAEEGHIISEATLEVGEPKAHFCWTNVRNS